MAGLGTTDVIIRFGMLVVGGPAVLALVLRAVRRT